MGTITATVTEGTTVATGGELSPSTLNSIAKPTVTITTPISIANGGTNATSASVARVQLGLGTIATLNVGDVSLTGGTISGILITLPSYATSALPSPGTAGKIVFVTDGDGGDKCLGVDDGSAWKRVALGATCSAT